MRKSLISLAVIGVVAISSYYISFSKKESGKSQVIQHFREAEVINPLGTIKFEPSWFDAENQVVVYASHVGSYSMLNFDWNQFVLDNPEVKFIMYYSGKDSEKLSSFMQEKKFEFPVLFDPERNFFKKNVKGETAGIAFLVKNGVKIGMSNPSFPEFQERLDWLVKQD